MTTSVSIEPYNPHRYKAIILRSMVNRHNPEVDEKEYPEVFSMLAMVYGKGFLESQEGLN